jgi:hypothetical protein
MLYELILGWTGLCLAVAAAFAFVYRRQIARSVRIKLEELGIITLKE